MILSATFEIKPTLADGVPCLWVRPPTCDFGYVIPIDHVRRAIHGIQHHRPGALVCGFEHHVMANGEPCPGWVVGYFDPVDLRAMLDQLTELG